MNIVVACCWPHDQGQGVSALSKELALHLALSGHRVGYLSPSPANSNWHIRHNIPLLSVDAELAPRDGLEAVLSAAKQFEADLVINNDHPYVQAALPYLSCRSVVICHAMAWNTLKLAAFNATYATCTVAISSDMWAKLANLKVPVEKLRLISNGIRKPERGRTPRPTDTSGPLRAVFAGNWTKVKGADKLIRAFSHAPAKIDWLQLDCFGEGRYLRGFTAQEFSWITLHGKVARNEFVNHLAEADLLLFPSRIEGCPMTVIEAMSLGVIPVVSDGRGDMRMMVTPGHNGYIARLDHWAADMWNILHHLNGNRHDLRRLSTNAVKRFETRYSIDTMANAILQSIEANSVSNNARPGKSTLLRWHRPHRSDQGFNALIQRVSYRLGWLRRSGTYRPD